ncbi:MAG TPA: site-specific integrase, partial [Candidatus Deferrimicrobiaceae bacterium]
MGSGRGRDLDALLDAFLMDLRTGRRLSRNTLEAYAFDLRRFSGFLHAGSIPLPEFRRTHFLQFLVSLQGLSARSVARHVSSVRSFFKFLVREGVLPASPVSEVRAPSIGRPLPKYLTVTEVE